MTPMADAPLLPPMITYDAIPGREGLWTATINTSAGKVSVTRHSLHETRDALETKVREALHGQRDGDGD